MHCSVYKGRKAADTYVYLPVKDDFSSLPADLRRAFGEPVHVMDLVLTPGRRLAQVEPRAVLRGLLEKGCYVQLPPRDYGP